jgi:UrcA family protein
VQTRKITCMAAATFVGSLLILSTVAPAHAQPPVIVEGHHYYDPENQRVVPYGDLNLAVSAGQQGLIRRVKYAVEDLCDTRHTRGLMQLIDSECSTSAWNSANPQITAAFNRAGSGSSIAAAAVTISLAH